MALPILGGRPANRAPLASLGLQTRCCNDIENDLSDVAMDPTDVANSDGMVRDLVARQYGASACRQLDLRRPANLDYNCHGMTFANRRTNIRASRTVEQILKDDGYQRVASESDVKPGDIVVYYEQGDSSKISHTGVVVRIERIGGMGSVPYVLSKWGRAGEYVHPVGVYPHAFSWFAYYREGQIRRGAE